jgi:hypothetical protein
MLEKLYCQDVSKAPETDELSPKKKKVFQEIACNNKICLESLDHYFLKVRHNQESCVQRMKHP